MIAVLAYHSIDESHSVLSTSTQVFADQMRVLYEQNISVLPLEDIAGQLSSLQSHKCAVVITFDDGFRSVYEHALPILRGFGFPATIFLVTDYCEKNNTWPSQPRGIKQQPLLRWSEIKEMSQSGLSFGSHSRTHPDLRALPITLVEEELVSSKKTIEDATDRPADTLAYPYGTYDAAVLHLARKHFRLACSTNLGFVNPKSDPFALERIEMYYFQSLLWFRHLFSPTGGGYLRLRRYLRDFRTANLRSPEAQWRERAFRL
jgi:peptidoglycan/xylan/chitin deacetylase (PgdA/CDA1 family)